MENEVIISKFEKEDADGVYEVVKESLSSTNALSKVYEEELLEIWRSLYSKKYIIGSSQFKHIYVAKLNGEVVGCAACELLEDSAYVSMVYINPNIQGKGIGKKLMLGIEEDEYCKQKGRITLSAALSAIKFYQKFGYKNPEEYPELIIDCGIEFMHLEKELQNIS